MSLMKDKKKKTRKFISIIIINKRERDRNFVLADLHDDCYTLEEIKVQNWSSHYKCILYKRQQQQQR